MRIHPSRNLPKISDEDIRWASLLLGLPGNAFFGEDHTDPRQTVFRSMKTLDVAACPGSGKTTLLVAKLAVLAEKWEKPNCGLCVLSHTNAARMEIEGRLGNTSAGRRLLSYPHFVGTIHAFVSEFLALPWLRSLGYPIKMIDNETAHRRRWFALPRGMRSALENKRHGPSVMTVQSTDFGVGRVSWNRGTPLGETSPTYCKIREVCRQSCHDGFFCFDEIFVWANDLLDHDNNVVSIIRGRFPLLFIDETQDNNSIQSEILNRAFMGGESGVVRQRFGDANQAIYNFPGASGTEKDKFPRDEIVDLPSSHRFGQVIGDLADPFGIIPYGLRGLGPRANLGLESGNAQHTIFLFDKNSLDKVLQSYGELLLATFSDSELQVGIFTAVGQVHKDKDHNHMVHSVVDYWPDYDSDLTSQNPRPKTMAQYVIAGVAKAQLLGETYPAVEKIAEGILRLVGIVDREFLPFGFRRCHRKVLSLLQASPIELGLYRVVIEEFAISVKSPSKMAWESKWTDVIKDIAEAIVEGECSSREAVHFLSWQDVNLSKDLSMADSGSQGNVLLVTKNGRSVPIRVGSIHSVKGETHCATLVLETFWNAHNLEKLKPWLVGRRKGWRSSDRVRQQDRLKVHYVAMTRPAHLLCLAMKRSSFESEPGKLDEELIHKMCGLGWDVKIMGEEDPSSTAEGELERSDLGE